MSKLETPAYDKKEVERVDKIIFECELNINSPYNCGYQIEWYEQQIKEMTRMIEEDGFSPKEAADLVQPPHFYFVEHHTGRTNQYDNDEEE